MLQTITSIALLLIALNQIVLVRRVRHHQKAISAIMDMLIKKWTMEMQMGESVMSKYIDQSLSDLFKGESD